jgi:hypothetical protein
MLTETRYLPFVPYVVKLGAGWPNFVGSLMSIIKGSDDVVLLKI